MHSAIANSVIRVVIVEDEAPARQKLKLQLAQIGGVELVAECDRALDAIEHVNLLKPDVVFLDIELGELNGFDVLDAIEHACHIIFTTAYSQYAVKAFDSRALDYLLKPFNLARLKEALSRVTVFQSSQAVKKEQRLIAKAGDRMHVIDSHDILYIAIANGLLTAYCTFRQFNLDVSLDKLTDELPPNFVRVHRSCIINTSHINQLDKWRNGTYLIKFKDSEQVVTTSRNGAAIIKQLFGL